MDVDDLRKKSDGDLRIIADMMGLGTSETSGHDELISLISEGGHVKKTARSAASEKRRAQARKSSDGNEGKAAEKKSPAEKNEINTSIVSKADALDIVNSEIKDNVDLNNGAAVSEKKKRGRPPKNTGEVKIISDKNSRITEVGEAVEKSDTEKKRRGRPKKSDEKPEAESMPSETGRSELSEPEANFSLEESKRAERETDTKKPGKMQKAASEVKNDKKTTNTAERSKSVRKEKRHNAAEKMKIISLRREKLRRRAEASGYCMMTRLRQRKKLI